MQPDTQKHWLRCPRFDELRAECPDLLSWIDDAPSCVVLHLLAPRSPFTLLLKRYFLDLPDLSKCFHSLPRTGIRNQLFTDGSFFKGFVFNLDRAAWAVVNASTNQTISYGCVPGILQTIGRAELLAIISAVEWAVAHDTLITIWTDSASTCSRANLLLHQPRAAFLAGENHDLWQRLAEALERTAFEQVIICWTPSHIDVACCDTSQEEFLATWNDIVDTLAVTTNRDRGFFLHNWLRKQKPTTSSGNTVCKVCGSFT